MKQQKQFHLLMTSEYRVHVYKGVSEQFGINNNNNKKNPDFQITYNKIIMVENFELCVACPDMCLRKDVNN